MPERAVVALDGFGAERGFDVLAEGARRAAADGIRLRVFGPPQELRLEDVAGIEVVPCAEAIGNDEDPVPAVRSRRDASIVRAAAAVSDGEASAMVSVGSTGAATMRPSARNRVRMSLRLEPMTKCSTGRPMRLATQPAKTLPKLPVGTAKPTARPSGPPPTPSAAIT